MLITPNTFYQEGNIQVFQKTRESSRQKDTYFLVELKCCNTKLEMSQIRISERLRKFNQSCYRCLHPSPKTREQIAMLAKRPKKEIIEPIKVKQVGWPVPSMVLEIYNEG